MELDLKNPIFAIYVDVRGHSKQVYIAILQSYVDYFNKYKNITAWIMPIEGQSKIECVFNGYNSDFNKEKIKEKINKVFDQLSNCKTYEEFRILFRNLNIETILEDGEEQETI